MPSMGFTGLRLGAVQKTLASFAIGFVATGVFSVFVQAPAEAVNSCLAGGDYAFKGGREAFSVANPVNHGTSGYVTVPSGGASCQQIASIYVGRGAGWAEFGWVRGWSNCTAGGADDVKYSRPTLFRWMVNSTGQPAGCRVFASRQPSAGTHTFRISDTNGNFYWGPWFDGEELEPSGVLLDFTTGASYVGMERGSAADSPNAEWWALGGWRSGGWQQWASHDKHPGNHGPGSYSIVAVDHGRTQ